MKHAVILILALAACHVVGSLELLNFFCSTKSNHLSRYRRYSLIGGKDANLYAVRHILGIKLHIRESPWMAYLHRNGKFICGGSLITDRFVLTAAHCIQSAKQIVVRLGEYDDTTQIDCREQGCAPPFEDHEVESFHPHPSFTNKTMFDIALLKLKANVRYHITPICLVLDTTDTWRRTVDSIQKFSVAGWGKTETGSLSHVLKTANVTQIDRYTCLADYGYDVDESHICAGDPARHTCDGDSGGPLVATVTAQNVDYDVQFGIVSYGEDPCRGVGVFTNVKSYIPWIVHTTSMANTVG